MFDNLFTLIGPVGTAVSLFFILVTVLGTVCLGRGVPRLTSGRS